MANGKMTITDVADRIGVTPKTIIRWEKSGKVNKPKRDWRLWRVYDKEDFKKLKAFKETVIYTMLIMSLFLSSAMAEDKPQAAAEAPTPAVASTPEKDGYTLALPSNVAGYEATAPSSTTSEFDSVKYTLGPDDVIDIVVMRHPLPTVAGQPVQRALISCYDPRHAGTGIPLQRSIR